LLKGHTRNYLSRTCYLSPIGTLEAFSLLSGLVPTITRAFGEAFPVARLSLFPLVAFVP
jgi:hypothetical protein